MPNDHPLNRYLSVLLFFATLGAALAFWALWPNDFVRAAMSEEGAVEKLTVVGYGVAALAVWLLRDEGFTHRTALAATTVLLAFGARELDWHRAWTGGSVLKVSYYWGPAPWTTKLVALSLVALCAAAMIDLVRRGARPLLRALRSREPAAITLAVFGVALVASKVIDRSLNIAREDFGLAIPVWEWSLQSAVEESLELLLPILVITALLQVRLRYRASRVKTVSTPV